MSIVIFFFGFCLSFVSIRLCDLVGAPCPALVEVPQRSPSHGSNVFASIVSATQRFASLWQWDMCTQGIEWWKQVLKQSCMKGVFRALPELLVQAKKEHLFLYPKKSFIPWAWHVPSTLFTMKLSMNFHTFFVQISYTLVRFYWKGRYHCLHV